MVFWAHNVYLAKGTKNSWSRFVLHTLQYSSCDFYGVDLHQFEPTSFRKVRHCTSTEGLVWYPLVQELNEAMFANTAPC